MYVTELIISLVSFFFQFQDTFIVLLHYMFSYFVNIICFAYPLTLCFCPSMLRNYQMDSYSYNKDCDTLNTKFSIVNSPDLENRCSFFLKYMSVFICTFFVICVYGYAFYVCITQ